MIRHIMLTERELTALYAVSANSTFFEGDYENNKFYVLSPGQNDSNYSAGSLNNQYNKSSSSIGFDNINPNENYSIICSVILDYAQTNHMLGDFKFLTSDKESIIMNSRQKGYNSTIEEVIKVVDNCNKLCDFNLLEVSFEAYQDKAYYYTSIGLLAIGLMVIVILIIGRVKNSV